MTKLAVSLMLIYYSSLKFSSTEICQCFEKE